MKRGQVTHELVQEFWALSNMGGLSIDIKKYVVMKTNHLGDLKEGPGS